MTRAIMLAVLLLLLAGCSAPTYTPDPQTMATREAQEYQTRTAHGAAAWKIGLGAVTVMLAILCGLVLYLSQTRYRVAAAKAALEEAKARRALLVDLGGGTMYDIKTGVMHKVNGGAMPSNIPPVMPVYSLQQAAAPQRQDDPLPRFVLDAVGIVSWQSNTFPRWERWKEKGLTMTAAEWQRLTDTLVGRGLLDPKRQGAETTIADGNDLHWLYDELTHPNGRE